jgi:dCMP deaminase
VGAVIVREKRILSTGYNGAPAGLPHCEVAGCLRKESAIPSGTRHELCRGLHAEQNAILQAAHYGIPIAGSILYCTNKPCVICAKMIINAGILEVFYGEGYNDPLADQLLEDACIPIKRYEP